MIDKEFERREIEKVVRCLKNGKAAGMDGLPYEMFKFGGTAVIDMLLELYNSVWNEEKVPSKWNESRVVLLHKGGHKNKKVKKL